MMFAHLTGIPHDAESISLTQYAIYSAAFVLNWTIYAVSKYRNRKGK
jgi:hypothetical protein